jgi:hypothetical protein
MAHSTFKVGDLTAVIGDNAAHEQHRAGYNGVWSLIHNTAGARSIFVPAVAGLNFEHIFNGEEPPDSKTFFEPRTAEMTFKQLSDSEGELHQPPTPTYHVESWTRFKLVAPHYLDMTFRCVPHQHVFPRGYMGLFWASYIHAPLDKAMYFTGGTPDQQQPLWTQLCTQFHNRDSTVLHREDKLTLTYAQGRDTLFKSLSMLRYHLPLFYGNHDGLMWIVMFDRTEGIRLAHSPSGGGVNAALQTTNPAWDFQFIVPKPEVMKEYGFKARTVLRPRCSRDEVLEEYRKWKEAK